MCVCWNVHWVLASLPRARNSIASVVLSIYLLIAPLPFWSRDLFLFSIFIFRTGSRFQPMTRVWPNTSLFLLNISHSMLHAPLQFSNASLSPPAGTTNPPPPPKPLSFLQAALYKIEVSGNGDCVSMGSWRT